MSGLLLTLRTPPRQRVDLSPLTPDRLRGLDAVAIAAIELASGNRRVRAGELFAVDPGDAGDMTIRGDCDRFDFIGRDMADGTLVVEGNAGAWLACGMKGGRLRVHGSAGPNAAAAMAGGRVEIDGNAGEFLGGAMVGETRGMTGGLVVVHGDAGERAGDRMRRGTIVVEGRLGAYAGSSMIAGTLLALGPSVGACPGFGMKRGTLLLRAAPARLLPGFVDCGSHELGFLRLLSGALERLGWQSPVFASAGRRVHRYAGDMGTDGKGEILVWTSASPSG
ncbi:MAG: formylmethanofuran dehydrogenase subunit C [Dongiaceae bacterium]